MPRYDIPIRAAQGGKTDPHSHPQQFRRRDTDHRRSTRRRVEAIHRAKSLECPSELTTGNR
jgi:hypothetical protein